MLPDVRASRLVMLACIAVAVGIAAPAILYCRLAGGELSCEWSFNRLGSTTDWRYFAEAWEAVRVSLVDFRQFPSWNPYHCGGIVLYQDPQASFPGPLLLLTVWWLPTGAAIKVWILVHLVVGALGARALIKDRGGNGAEQILGAVLIVACGFIAWHTGGGHLAFTPFLFLPVVMWAFRRSFVDARYAVLLAVMFAITFYEGAPYPVPMMAFAVGVEALARLGSAPERRRMALVLPLFGALFVLLAGVRLLPVWLYVRAYPRLMPLDDQMTLAEVVRAWILRTDVGALLPGHNYVWPEYADYVGVVPVVLVLIGVAVAFVRRDAQSRLRRIDLALLAMMVWAALGNIPGVSLYGLLHELPVYASLRVPSRFLGPAMVAFALVAISALIAARQMAVEKNLRPRFLKGILVIEVALVAAIAVDVITVNAPRMQQGLDPALTRVPASADFHQATDQDYGRFPTFPMRGIGSRVCVGPLHWKPAPGLVDGKVPQQRVEPAAAGDVVLKRWSPNAVHLRANLRAPALVIINQNYETGWGSNVGQIGAYIAPDSRFWARPPRGVKGAPPVGLLAVSLPAGVHELTVRHRPPGLGVGLLMTLLGIVLSTLVVRKLTPQRIAALSARWRRRLIEPAPASPPSGADSP